MAICNATHSAKYQSILPSMFNKRVSSEISIPGRHPLQHNKYKYECSMTIYFTTAGFVIPSVTGSISCISSLAIIYIIVRSKSNIMDVLNELLRHVDIIRNSIALTKIPMPNDVIYPFEGSSYGATATCEVQGMVFFLHV